MKKSRQMFHGNVASVKKIRYWGWTVVFEVGIILRLHCIFLKELAQATSKDKVILALPSFTMTISDDFAKFLYTSVQRCAVSSLQSVFAKRIFHPP